MGAEGGERERKRVLTDDTVADCGMMFVTVRQWRDGGSGGQTVPGLLPVCAGRHGGQA